MPSETKPSHRVRVVELTSDDLARIDSYYGGAEDLHQFLNTVLPLQQPMLYRTKLKAKRGTELVMEYGAEPADDGIDITWAWRTADHSHGIAISPPACATTTGLSRPAGIDDDSWRELRVAAGLVIRALLLRIGEKNV